MMSGRLQWNNLKTLNHHPYFQGFMNQIIINSVALVVIRLLLTSNLYSDQYLQIQCNPNTPSNDDDANNNNNNISYIILE